MSAIVREKALARDLFENLVSAFVDCITGHDEAGDDNAFLSSVKGTCSIGVQGDAVDVATDQNDTGNTRYEDIPNSKRLDKRRNMHGFPPGLRGQHVRRLPNIATLSVALFTPPAGHGFRPLNEGASS